MNQQQKLELAANILTKGKALTPDRFPKPSPDVAQAWAGALSKLFDTFPVGIWPEAVELWAMELVGDSMITPKELKAAAYTVRDRWEADGQKREILRQVRERNEAERDRQIAAGTFGELRGYKPSQRTNTPGGRELEGFLDNIGKAV